MSNLKQHFYPIESVSSIFKKKTAVIVSAGPSLNKNIHLINQLKNKAVVIAVGSAIKILDSHGIVPHFRMAMDGLPREKKFLEGIDTEAAPLLCTNKLYYEILPEYKGDKFRVNLVTEHIGGYLNQIMNIPNTKFMGGASVANAALDMLCKFGCERIIFMGQDLSYTGKELHAKGVNTEGEEQKYVDLRVYQERENIFGEKVYTISPFLDAKHSMENTIKRHTDIEYINATEGGLGIDGTVIMNLRDVLDNTLKDVKEIKVEQDISSVLNENETNEEYNQKIHEGVKKIKDELIELREIQSEIFKYVHKIQTLKESKKSLNRISNDLRYVENLERSMKDIAFYTQAVLPSLEADLSAIQASLKYKGDDRLRHVQAKEQIITKRMLIIKQFIDVALAILEKDIKY